MGISTGSGAYPIGRLIGISGEAWQSGELADTVEAEVPSAALARHASYARKGRGWQGEGGPMGLPMGGPFP